MDLLEVAQRSSEKFWADAGNYGTDRGYGLTSESFVLDIGGYHGDWTAYIVDRYHCCVSVYEPVKEFYDKIVERFILNQRVQPFNVALEARDYEAPVALMGQESSIHRPARGDAPIVNVRDIAALFEREGNVSLLALNAEGSEYLILDRLLTTGLISRVEHLLVQFHPFVQGAEECRDVIRKRLGATHFERFCYPFCWEAWSRL